MNEWMNDKENVSQTGSVGNNNNFTVPRREVQLTKATYLQYSLTKKELKALTVPRPLSVTINLQSLCWARKPGNKKHNNTENPIIISFSCFYFSTSSSERQDYSPHLQSFIINRRWQKDMTSLSSLFWNISLNHLIYFWRTFFFFFTSRTVFLIFCIKI